MTDRRTKPHEYTDDVTDAIAGHGADDPVELWHLHEAIDWRERDAIDVDELNAIPRLARRVGGTVIASAQPSLASGGGTGASEPLDAGATLARGLARDPMRCIGWYAASRGRHLLLPGAAGPR